MKSYYFFVIKVLLVINLFAQAPPQSFSFQAVVRGSKNALIINKPVGLKISILQYSQQGASVYVETQNPTTNENSKITIAIGSGTKLYGDFSSIDWSNGPYFVKIETDPSGGNSYSLTSISQLLSVPYAMFAANNLPGPKGDKGDDGDQGTPGISLDEQKLSVSTTGDTLFLTNGDFVIIPMISNANHPTSGYGPNIKDRSGNSYKTVYIGSQHWMAQNLKTNQYNDGSYITYINSNDKWITNNNKDRKGAYCNYGNLSFEIKNGEKLYNGFAVIPSLNGGKNICPIGWHVPSEVEWNILTDYLGGEGVAGGKMIQLFFSENPNALVSNVSLFSGELGGYRENYMSYPFSVFYGAGDNGYWWSSSTTFFNQSIFSLSKSGVISRQAPYQEGNSFSPTVFLGVSVRCLKD
jgi:uncharacterized protein (TIGR02145 family)